jgi:transcriptional regulator with XRE-family HTH domain
MASSIRKWRKRRGLRQREVAQILGVTVGQVSHYETGRHVLPAEKAVLLAKVTQTDPHVFRPDLFPKKRFEAA